MNCARRSGSRSRARPRLRAPRHRRTACPGGPKSWKRRSSSRSCAPLAVTSALSSSAPARRACTRGVGEREALHLLARDAPVGVEVEHHRASGRCSSARSSSATLRTGRKSTASRRARRPGAQMLQRLQRVAAPRGCADELHHADHAHHGRCDQSPQRPATGTPELEQRHGTADQQRAPQRQRQRGRQHRLHGPDRDADQQHAEELLDAFHPRAGARKQRAFGDAQHEQRHAHAAGQREQGRATEHRRRASGSDRRARRPAAPRRRG